MVPHRKGIHSFYGIFKYKNRREKGLIYYYFLFVLSHLSISIVMIMDIFFLFFCHVQLKCADLEDGKSAAPTFASLFFAPYLNSIEINACGNRDH